MKRCSGKPTLVKHMKNKPKIKKKHSPLRLDVNFIKSYFKLNYIPWMCMYVQPPIVSVDGHNLTEKEITPNYGGKYSLSQHLAAINGGKSLYDFDISG